MRFRRRMRKRARRSFQILKCLHPKSVFWFYWFYIYFICICISFLFVCLYLYIYWLFPTSFSLVLQEDGKVLSSKWSLGLISTFQMRKSKSIPFWLVCPSNQVPDVNPALSCAPPAGGSCSYRSWVSCLHLLEWCLQGTCLATLDTPFWEWTPFSSSWRSLEVEHQVSSITFGYINLFYFLLTSASSLGAFVSRCVYRCL